MRVLSTMNGSSNWYCISSRDRTVGFVTAMARRSRGWTWRSRVRDWPAEAVHDVDELAGGVGVGVVRQVPHLPGGVRVLAEDGQALADVGDERVRVRLVGVAENGGGAPGQGGREDPVAEV